MAMANGAGSARMPASSTTGGGTGGRRRGRRRLELQRLRDRALGSVGVWLAVLVLAGTWLLAPDGTFLRPRFEVGQIAAHDHLASRDLLLLDEATTEDKRRRAREAVLTIYDLDGAKEAAQDEQFSRLFTAGREVLRARAAMARCGRCSRSAARCGSTRSRRGCWLAARFRSSSRTRCGGWCGRCCAQVW
jgi:membrane-associated HD superfamily phosphohydrolase